MTTDRAIWQIESGGVYTVDVDEENNRFFIMRGGTRAKNVRHNKSRDGMTEAQLQDFAAQVERERDRVDSQPWARAARRFARG